MKLNSILTFVSLVSLTACSSGGGNGTNPGTGGGTTGGTSAGGSSATGGVGGSGAIGGENTGGVGVGGESGSGGSTGGSAGQATGGSAGAASGGAAGASGGSGGSGGATGGSGGATGGAGGSGGGTTCTPPISGTCDTFPQCGCPGQNCDVLDNAGKTGCVNAGGVSQYAQCTAMGQCGAGHTCVGDVCKPFCTTHSDCPGASKGAQCIQAVYDDNGATKPIPGMYVCTAACNPIDTTTCGPGAGCLLAGGTSDCIPAGLGVGANACAANPNNCAPGYICLTDDSCRKWCRVGLNDCTGGQACNALPGPVLYMGYTWGVCY